ncbi:MAG: hypothetical protein U0V49_00385 [Saprospiraceae bacterium]
MGISQKIPLADMLLESMLHKRWLNCKSTKLDLVAESPAQANKCYKWSARAFGTSTYVEIAHNTPEMGKQSVAPIKTYWYKCERFNNGQCSGQPEMVWYFKVYVVEAVQLTSLVLNGEYVYDLNSGIIPSIPPETMDEYNDYRLSGELTIGDIVELPKDLSMLSVNLHFITDIGQNIPDSYPRIEDRSLRSEGFFPFVQQDGLSKEYLLKIKAECCGLVSNEFKVKVKRLWIEKFSHPTINSASKWHVVVNDPVNCEASAANTIHHFEWYPYYKGWTFEDNISNTSIWNNLKFKPANGVMPKSNSEFGDKYGAILLKCSDKKGNVMGVMSSKEIINDISSDVFNMFDKWRPMNSNKAKIFFHKNDLIKDDDPTLNGDEHDFGNIPQWLYYWRNDVQRSAHIKKVRWIDNQPGFFAYTGRPDRAGITPARIGYKFTPMTTNVQDKVGNSKILIAGNNLTGIYAFYSVMVHESWHADFITERWKNGYDPQNDAEPTLKTSKLLKPIYGDYYPDSWESNPFSKLIDDYYGNSGSIGNKYEEMMGNKAEKESFLNGKTEYSKSYDWSFEKNPLLSDYQGKQWNK